MNPDPENSGRVATAIWRWSIAALLAALLIVLTIFTVSVTSILRDFVTTDLPYVGKAFRPQQVR
jgi:biopolymer transport protein ExbD